MDETDGILVIKEIFEAWDTNKSGYIEKAELSECCENLKLSPSELERVFNELDVNKDGRISISDFYESFGKVCRLFHVSQDEVLLQDVSEYKKFEKLIDAIGLQNYLTGHEYVTEMFHHIQNSGDSPQLLSLLESFLFSVIRDIKTYESENQKLEDALKRTCEKHAEHMENLDEEMEHQLSKFEKRIKKEEQTKYERSSMDIIWQMENKNKEIQALQARIQKLETKIKRKEPEEQKLKEELEERVQEIRYLRSQVTDAQTNMAVLRSELIQARNDYEDQSVLLQNEKHTIMECVQEQESLTRQLQLLHEANKKLHDTNDNLRSALEAKRGSEIGRSPSPSKRSSISTLYSPAPKPHKRTKSTSHSPGFLNGSEDRLSNSLGAIPLRSPLNSTGNSRRSSLLLPVQQSAEEDEARTNEDSLLEEFMGVNYPRMTNEDSKVLETTAPTDKTTTNELDTKTTNTTESEQELTPETGKESTTDVTDTSDSAKSDKFPRTRTGSARISTKLGKYLVKLKHVTKSNTAIDKSSGSDRGKGASANKVNQEKPGHTKRKSTEGIEKKAKRNKKEEEKEMAAKSTKKQREHSSKDLSQNHQKKRASGETSLPANSVTNTITRTKSSSVTFAPTVSSTRAGRDKARGRDVIRRPGLLANSRHLNQDSESSDTETSGRLDLKLNLPDGTEEEDEAYGTLPSSERESMRMQLNLLTETNKRLCESNSDLRLALETVTKRVPKAKSREKCKRNPSFHSDYGSISSRSATPSQLQGPKSENDVADGAEDLSGYEPESEGNNTSTLTLQGHHEEQRDGISKTLATPREKIQIAGRDTGEDGNELETADEEVEQHENKNEDGKIGDIPFMRNSLLRKPLRHKSIEALASEMESGNAKGGKEGSSTWPAIVRNGKWISMEQVRKNNEFVGARSRSLPASRCSSSERLDFQTGVGVNELSEKLNALKTSQENVSSGTKIPESEECGVSRDAQAETVSGTVKSDRDEPKEIVPEDSLKEDTSIQVENKVQRSPSKSTNTIKIEMVSSAVQVNLSSGRNTPQEAKPSKTVSNSQSKQTKDKRKETYSPKEARAEAIMVPTENKSADVSKEQLEDPKGQLEDQNRQLESPKGHSKGAKEGSNTSSISRLSSREESPFRPTSTRPYSRNSKSSILPHNNLLTPRHEKEPKKGKENDSSNRGRSEILSLIAGERPGQDLTTVQNLRIDVDINSKPQTNCHINPDLNRSITNDIFAPLNKSCPNFSTRQSTSDQHKPERNIGLDNSRSSWLKLHKASPYGGALVNRVKTESVPDSDLSRVELLSAELEAQFKSVKEEDEEDIDEDDVDDEELAQLVAMATGLSESDEETESEPESPEGLRPTTIGTADLSEASTNTSYSQSTTQDLVPERLFKLVLAGDAAVGKSSFILRLCRNRFHNALNSTLGVDFQMKNLVVDGKTIALQLWDTAGQERFRSIAKSYFRKADGVLLLYDVTCETSFLDVRDWVEAIEESCTKPVPIMMCGNKTDLRPGNIAEGKTVISTESGQKIAKEYGALFMETSAKDNKNIEEACVKLARMLQDLEDNDLHKDPGMQLSEADAKQKKKSSCCSR